MRLTEAEKKLIMERRRKNRRKRKPTPRKKTAVKRKVISPAVSQFIASVLWLVIIAIVLSMLAAK